MSTNGCIAKPESDGWRGRYHHSDSYPTALGDYLIRAYNGFFGGDLEAMTKFFIDDEKVGWSFVIDTDLSLGPQWHDTYPKDEQGWADFTQVGPQSYTARGHPHYQDDPTGDWITSQDGDLVGIEWVYVLAPAGLLVVCGAKTPVAIVPWGTEDPLAVMQKIQEDVYV